MTVALVPPKRGVFQESVKHVLAVATTVEVVLLAVTFQGESKATSSRNRRIQVMNYVSHRIMPPRVCQNFVN